MPDWYLQLPIIGHWPAWLTGGAAGVVLAFMFSWDKLADVFVRSFSGGEPLHTANPPDRALLSEDPDRGTISEWLRSFLSNAVRMAAIFAVLGWALAGGSDYLNNVELAGAAVALVAAYKVYVDQGRHGSMVGEPEFDKSLADSDSSPAAVLFFAAIGVVLPLLLWLF
ncbi:hypothetical protein GRI89_09405 [Altererythrobacter salegens]|uniref:Uncharacterized protein n=1 Tax=Croceibacterium salegens TaxID=1737568 RepID=A0A6I4SUG7_9SPHN|nr:hypothetical protein [Croceibacterium salegens]MXO59754.1 hypothetical protein [Croceibacterium salegens]